MKAMNSLKVRWSTPSPVQSFPKDAMFFYGPLSHAASLSCVASARTVGSFQSQDYLPDFSCENVKNFKNVSLDNTAEKIGKNRLNSVRYEERSSICSILGQPVYSAITLQEIYQSEIVKHRSGFSEFEFKV